MTGEMFANAVAYNRMMGRWSARLALQFLDFSSIPAGRILDVGCGTGSLVQALAARPGNPEIVGIDLAQPLIDYCRQQFTGPRFSFDCGNGMQLPYGDDFFDHALSLLVFMFIPEPAKAAAEMRRVTRPGGTVAACTWDGGSGGGSEIVAAFWEEAARLDPAAEHRPERQRHCNREGELAALWRGTGFGGVEETALEMRMDFSSFDDYWEPFLGGIGPHGVYVAELSAGRRGALRQALRNRFLGGGPDGPISIHARAWAVRGVVPG